MADFVRYNTQVTAAQALEISCLQQITQGFPGVQNPTLPIHDSR